MIPSTAVAVLLITVGQGRTAVPPARTLIGCVERSDDDRGLLLTHVSVDGGQDPQPRAAKAPLDARYRLSGVAALDLESLVGHTVRVAGFVEKEPPRTGGPAQPADPDERSTPPRQRPSAAAQTFRAGNVQSIAPVCDLFLR
jgi:hypothetical protein